MSIKKSLFVLALATTATAQAVTYTAPINATPVDPFVAGAETLLVDFDSALPAGYSLSGSYGLATGTVINVRATPAGDTTQYFYTSPSLATNTATLSTPDLATVSFYWGSIDAQNRVDILGAGGATIFTLFGSAMPPANGNHFLASTNRRVYFTAGAGETITGLTFSTTKIAFEIDDLAGTVVGGGGNPGGTVPEPAAWALMITGFGMVGLAARRRRTTQALVA